MSGAIGEVVFPCLRNADHVEARLLDASTARASALDTKPPVHIHQLNPITQTSCDPHINSS